MTVPAVQPIAGRSLRFRERLRDDVPAVVVFVALLIGWQLLPNVMGDRAFLFPPPTKILAALVENADVLRKAAFATLYEAYMGLAIGIVLGVSVAVLAARFARVRGAVVPIAVAASAVPIIAISPIMNNWFGTNSPNSKIAIVILLVFFPIMINVSRGLTQVPPASLELMRSYAASQGTVLRKVRLPHTLPFFFTALKVSTTLALIGAIVGEYFGGSSEVLGYVIVSSASRLRYDVTWAAVWIAAAAGIVSYLVIVLLERALIPWHASQRAVET